MTNFLYTILLSILPISELRGGIPFAIALGYNPLLSFLVLTLANILMIPIIFIFLDYFHKHFLKIKIYEKLFNKLIIRTRNKIEHRIGTRTEFLALFLLVAIPLPGTGAYSGCLAAWLFNLKRRKSILTISLGVLTAGILVTLATLGLVNLFT
tara:strand:- start:491 stop:949 length:459 start_codon:yes stop_codon:yes gene_type:complete